MKKRMALELKMNVGLFLQYQKLISLVGFNLK